MATKANTNVKDDVSHKEFDEYTAKYSWVNGDGPSLPNSYSLNNHPPCGCIVPTLTTFYKKALIIFKLRFSHVHPPKVLRFVTYEMVAKSMGKVSSLTVFRKYYKKLVRWCAVDGGLT